MFCIYIFKKLVTCHNIVVLLLFQLEGAQISSEEALLFKKCLKAISEALQENENKLNELDKGCGDGDTGSTLCRMANGILIT